MLASNLELDDRPGIFATLESLVKHYPQPKYWNDLLNNQLFASKTDRELRSLYRLMEDTKVARQVRGIHRDGHRARRWRFPERSQARAREGNVAGRAAGRRQGSCASRTWSVPARAPSRIARSLPARTRRSRRPRPVTTWCRSASSTSARATYAKSADAIQKGLAKGGVSDADDANTLLGIALARAAKPADAVAGLPGDQGSEAGRARAAVADRRSAARGRKPPRRLQRPAADRPGAGEPPAGRQLACSAQTRAISASLGSFTCVKALLASLLRLVRASAIPSSMLASSALLTPPLASALRSASTAFG